MIPSLKTFLIVTATLVVLDLVWLGVIMAPFYQNHLRPLLNFVDGKLEPRIIPTLLTYVIMIALVLFFAIPVAKTCANGSNLTIFGVGAILGLLVYGLYNFTNLSLIKDWSTAVTIVDTLWGAFLFGLATLLALL